jgi:hypothetical protein
MAWMHDTQQSWGADAIVEGNARTVATMNLMAPRLSWLDSSTRAMTRCATAAIEASTTATGTTMTEKVITIKIASGNHIALDKTRHHLPNYSQVLATSTSTSIMTTTKSQTTC